MAERREHPRHEVWFPIEVEIPDGNAVAVSYDLSEGGLLMAVGDRLEVGQDLAISFRVTKNAPEKRLRGRIVRVEHNPPSVDAFWRYRIALAFDEPQTELATLIASRAKNGSRSAS